MVNESALEKVFHTDLSLREIADQLGIPHATLHTWKRQYQMNNDTTEPIQTPTESWSPEEKFAVVLPTATLSEAELNAYCREKGVYPGQIKAWREPAFAVTSRRMHLRREAIYQQKKRKIKALGGN